MTGEALDTEYALTKMMPDVSFAALSPTRRHSQFWRLMPSFAEITLWRLQVREWRLAGQLCVKERWKSALESWWFGAMPVWRSFVDDLVAKSGVIGSHAARHLRWISQSMQPQHEDKMTAMCILCEAWFETPDFDAYERRDREYRERRTARLR